MTRNKKALDCCSSDTLKSCCKIEAIVSVDERGQMVLPKEAREQAKIHPGEKLALISAQQDGKVCCLLLMKVEEFNGLVTGMLGPLFDEITK